MNCKKPLRGKKGNRTVVFVRKRLKNVKSVMAWWDSREVRSLVMAPLRASIKHRPYGYRGCVRLLMELQEGNGCRRT